jgi:hypothetical protein
MLEAALSQKVVVSFLLFLRLYSILFSIRIQSGSGIGTGMHCGFGSAEAKGSGSGSTTLARGKECAMIGGGGEENEKASASSKLFPLYHVCVFDAKIFSLLGTTDKVCAQKGKELDLIRKENEVAYSEIKGHRNIYVGTYSFAGGFVWDGCDLH